jgi:hypothetical protein
MRCVVVERERLVELDRLDRTTLLAEPASFGDGREVEARDGGLEVRPGQDPVLIITCLMNV